ncbi:aspartate dehydrogenase [Clostridium sp. BJN0001]|uniref:aspartate dehydrogenase n=1 Tax=Clostridium sp. BJN0001 TaxID=2930219 RepID=UPI001FD3B89E|nr:aspartate dehydrogenase [Clostridium sp. BJN0001]
MFFKKKKKMTVLFDSKEYKPVLKCSVCTGEKTAGFMEIKTGKFIDICLIKNDKDLQKFKSDYKVDNVEKIY